VITALGFNTVTVKNQGNAAAGAFNISLPGNGVVRINSLAAGASATATYNTATCSLPVFQAKADSSNEVAESNESNNTSGLTIPIIC
jgi:subtilase family serine protease